MKKENLANLGITSVTIPNTVTTIGTSAFTECYSLYEITCNATTAPTIGSNAFYNCSSLTSVTIPASVTSIVDYAFTRCSSLTFIKCNGLVPPVLGHKEFDDSSCLIYVPCGSVDAYKNGDYFWSDFADRIVCVNYTELCFIEKKTGYMGNVDLGVKLTNNFKIQISFNYKTAAGGMLIGEGGDTRFFKASNGNTYLDLNQQRISWDNSSFCPMNTDVTFEIGNRYMKNLGNDLEKTGSTITFTSGGNLLLFSSGGNDLAAVYWVKVYDGNTLVGDFIPVRRTSDNVITMFNKVTDTYCSVNGTLYGTDECMTYRWTPCGTTCDNANKYQNNIKEYSRDGGETWSAVIPERYSASTLIEQDSYDCGYRIDTTTGTPWCTGYDKYAEVYTRESRDGGTTWITAATATTLIEANSIDCGYTPLTPFNGKYILALNSVSTVSAECDSTSSITYSELSAYTYSAINVIIGSCVTVIEPRAFVRYIMTSVTLSDSVTEIREFAFSGSSIESIIIPDSVTDISYSVFHDCEALTSVTIGNNVRLLGHSAFRGCSGLTSVIIPSSVTWITDYAFSYCIELTSVTVLSPTPAHLGDGVFDHTPIADGTGFIYVPPESVNNYKSASGWSTYASRIQAITDS